MSKWNLAGRDQPHFPVKATVHRVIACQWRDAAVRRIVDTNRNLVTAFLQQFGDVKTKTRKTAGVASGMPAVDPRFSDQQGAIELEVVTFFVACMRQVQRAAIPGRPTISAEAVGHVDRLPTMVANLVKKPLAIERNRKSRLGAGGHWRQQRDA